MYSALRFLKKYIIYIKTYQQRTKLSRNNSFDRSNNFGESTILNKTSWGKNSGCNKACFLNRVSIGNYVSIAGNVKAGFVNRLSTQTCATTPNGITRWG
mgnify:CR=1 FL=1